MLNSKTVSLSNVKEADLFGFIGVIPNKKRKDKKYFYTLRDIDIILSNGHLITIPEGFNFDGSSSPRYLWALFPRYGSFLFASLVHDYLYVIKYNSEKIGDKEAQKFADNEMLIWSNATHQSKINNLLRYYAVRVFGKFVFQDKIDII